MRAPNFWRTANFLAKSLTPLGTAYNFAVQVRRCLVKSKKVSVPVICVGNILMGGSGKTTVTTSLVELLRSAGLTPHILSRGYKAKLPGPLAVNTMLHQPEDVGDEPLLLAAKAPVWIGKDRYKSAVKAIQHGATVLVLDDGFQNPHLAKDFSILVFDGQQQIGNGYVFPAGLLREKVADGLRRADAIILIDFATTPDWCQHPHVFHAKTQYHLKPSCDKYVAFAGIGYPEKFFDGLRCQGFNLVETRSFADHHTYSQADFKSLTDSAKEQQAQLITTAKDHIRIPKAFQSIVQIQPISLDFRDESLLLTEIMREVKNTLKVTH